jgi:hypothetical protein
MLALPLAAGIGSVQQLAGQPALHLLRIAAGPAGVEKDGVFAFTEERTTFSRVDDAEVIVVFQWEGTPGLKRMVATWRGPDGSVSTSASVEYEARTRRFGGYWRLTILPHTALGTWSIEVAVDGVPAGRFSFEIRDETAPPAPPVKRLLTQRDIYELLNRVYVVLERSTADGRALESGAALLGTDGRLYTTMETLDEADRLTAVTGDGASHTVSSVLAWNRRQQWAVLAGGPSFPAPLEVAPVDSPGVGDRCFAMEGTAASGRILMEGTITGRTISSTGPPRLIASFLTAAVRPGSPVVNESGQFLGIVAGAPNTLEMLYSQGALRGVPILPLSLFRLRDDAEAVKLDELRASGRTLAPVTGEAHIVSGGFSAGIRKAPIVAPADQRQEFHAGEKGFTVFVTWSPRERLRGLIAMKLYDDDGRLVGQSKPLRRDLRANDLVLTSWNYPIPAEPGRYRADVLFDDRVMWRGYVRVTR